MNQNAFLQDLAMVMAVAGLASALFSRLKWPKVIGFLLVGILLGGKFLGTTFLADESSVQTIAQLGLIFLMLTMGLSFSAREMAQIKSIVVPTAILDTVVMTWLGYTFGRTCLGWSSIPSFFLGVAICDSSTSLLAKIIGEMNWTRRPFVKYILGTSICEDVVCVGLLALATGLAHGRGMSLAAAGLSIGGLLLFSFAVIVLGFVWLTRSLNIISERSDDETLLLTALGGCFFVTFIAFRLDYSVALGAFLTGILCSVSEARRRLVQMFEPLKSMFAAVFFVSIGLMIDPLACWNHIGAILALSLLVIVGKGLNCFFGSLLMGESLRTSIQIGFGLAQIGEFAFMVGLLYLTATGDRTAPMYQIVAGVSLLTTMLNPMLLRTSEPVADWVEKKCPRRIKTGLHAYQAFLANYRKNSLASADRNKIRTPFWRLVSIAVLELAIAIALSLLNGQDWSWLSPRLETYKRLVFCLLLNLFVVASLAPLWFTAKRFASALSSALTDPLKLSTGPKQALSSVVRVIAIVMVLAVFFIETVMLNVNLMPNQWWLRLLIFALLLATGFIGWQYFLKSGHEVSRRFRDALSSDPQAPDALDLSWTIPGSRVARLMLKVSSPLVGETVVSSNIRARTGVSVLGVERKGVKDKNFSASYVFAVGDVLVVTGDSVQIARFIRLAESKS